MKTTQLVTFAGLVLLPFATHAQFGSWLGASAGGDSQRVVGVWSGTRSERNMVTGGTFTVNFDFEFRSNGTYVQRARFGRLPVLELSGTFSLSSGRKPGDPSFTHILRLVPVQVVRSPEPDELRALLMADLPALQATQHYVQFYNLAPAGALTLQNVSRGSESWGLQRER